MTTPPRPKAIQDLLDDHWMTTQEACQYLSVHKDWLYSHLHEIPSVKIGRLRRFRASELVAWVEANRDVA